MSFLISQLAEILYIFFQTQLICTSSYIPFLVPHPEIIKHSCHILTHMTLECHIDCTLYYSHVYESPALWKYLGTQGPGGDVLVIIDCLIVSSTILCKSKDSMKIVYVNKYKCVLISICSLGGNQWF